MLNNNNNNLHLYWSYHRARLLDASNYMHTRTH